MRSIPERPNTAAGISPRQASEAARGRERQAGPAAKREDVANLRISDADREAHRAFIDTTAHVGLSGREAASMSMGSHDDPLPLMLSA